MVRKRRKKLGSRAGKIFEAEVRRSLKNFQKRHPHTFYFHRLSDTYDYIKVPNVILPKQPADFLALYNGKFYLLEAKSTRADRFNMSYVKPHQKQAMLQVTKCGGRSILLISLRRSRPVKCFAYDILEYVRLEKEFVGVRKSIPRVSLEKVGLGLRRVRSVGGSFWSFGELFEKVK